MHDFEVFSRRRNDTKTVAGKVIATLDQVNTYMEYPVA